MVGCVRVNSVEALVERDCVKRLKLNCDTLLSIAAFNSNLRLYIMIYIIVQNYVKSRISETNMSMLEVGRCRLTVSNPVLKAPTV
jgi:hypothetical protein